MFSGSVVLSTCILHNVHPQHLEVSTVFASPLGPERRVLECSAASMERGGWQPVSPGLISLWLGSQYLWNLLQFRELETQIWGKKLKALLNITPPCQKQQENASAASGPPSPGLGGQCLWLSAEPRVPQPCWPFPLQRRLQSLPHPPYLHHTHSTWARAGGALWGVPGSALMPGNAAMCTEGEKSEASHLLLKASAS